MLGFFFMLRRSEYLSIDKQPTCFCLRTENALYSDAKGNQVGKGCATSVTIGLAGAKNDQFGRRAWRTMHRTGHHSHCPVKALQHIHRARRELNLETHKHLCAGLQSNTVSEELK